MTRFYINTNKTLVSNGQVKIRVDDNTQSTTTTTTAAPGVDGYIVSGAGDTNYNGTYCEVGILNGKPYYANSNNTLFIFWDSFDGGMWSISNSFDVANVPPGYYKYTNDNTPPLSNYQQVGAIPPSPVLTPTTCSATTTTTTTTAAPASLAITQQPKNNYGITSNDGTFSVTAVGVGPLSYQWQEARRDGGNYGSWENLSGGTVSGATTANLTINPTRYDSYGLGVKLRVIVTDTNDSATVTSQEVHWVDYYSVNGGYDLFNYGVGGATTTVNGVTYQNLDITGSNYYGAPEFYAYLSHGDWDSDWYTGSATTFKVQMSTDATNWVDDVVVNGNPGIDSVNAVTDRAGFVSEAYYRTMIIKNWPLNANDGTQSATRSPIETFLNFYKVIWTS